MDFKALMDGSDGMWTEERHSLFLNTMEDTFVRRLLGVDLAGAGAGGGGGGGGGAVPCWFNNLNGGLRLERYVSVSATESTAESRRRSPAPAAEAAVESESLFTGGNNRKRPHALVDASRDQVVPQFENTEDSVDASGPFKRKNGRGGS